MKSHKSVSVYIELKFELKQWLNDKDIQQVLHEMFRGPLSEDDIGHLEEDYSDSDEHSPEIDEKGPKEVIDTCNELVSSTSNKSFGFH